LRDFNAALYGKLYVDEFTKSVLLSNYLPTAHQLSIFVAVENFLALHCEPPQAAKQSPYQPGDCFATLAMTWLSSYHKSNMAPVCLQSPEIILLLINLARWMFRGGFLLESIPGNG
jgi:hypothetical protein